MNDKTDASGSKNTRDLGFAGSAPPEGGAPRRDRIDPDRRCGIVIGVNRYEAPDDDIRDLGGCIHDARAMYDLMTDHDIGRFKPENVLFLRSDASDRTMLPTKRNILDAIELLGDRNKEFDELWFYFAGHGYASPSDRSKDAFLVPSDATVRCRRAHGKEFDRESLVSTKSLHESYFRNLFPTQTIVMFLDCCCSGSMGDASARGATPATQEAERAAFQEARIEESPEEEKGGYYCFQAADRFQAAKEELEGGVFTRHLLSALRGNPLPSQVERTSGKDGFVTVASIAYYLSKAVTGQNPGETVSGKTDHPLSWDPERVRYNQARDRALRTAAKWINSLDQDESFRIFDTKENGFNVWRDYAKEVVPAPPAFMDALLLFSAEGSGASTKEAKFVAARILSALCEAGRVDALRRRIEQLEREKKSGALVEKDSASASAKPEAPARRLSVGESRRLRSVADAVTPEWRRNPEIGPLLDSLRRVQTEPEALTALRAFEDLVRDEFLGANDGSAAGRGLRRLQPLFLPEAWTGPRRDLLELETPSKTDGALLVLFRVAGTCCIRR